MDKSNLRSIALTPLITILATLAIACSPAYAVRNKVGVSLKLGMNKLDGDWQKPKINPDAAFCLLFSPNPFLSLEGEIAYSILRTNDNSSRIDPSLAGVGGLRTFMTPIGMALRFNFFPLSKVRPFASIGGGAIWWDSKYGDKTITSQGTKQQHRNLFLKAGGGLEIQVSPGFAVFTGSDFRYSSSDILDQINSGDEKDGIITGWGGVTYYFARHDPRDRDGDNIPRELDLSPQEREDRNGYMDHDGRPEGEIKEPLNKNAPIVIHHPIFEAEEKHNLKINADIISEVPLRTAAVLYRSLGNKNWQITKFEPIGASKYQATIKGQDVTATALEYCAIAVDQNVKGIGYSGLPNRPVQVKLLRHGTVWRALGAITAAAGWGLSTYIILRKQS